MSISLERSRDFVEPAPSKPFVNQTHENKAVSPRPARRESLGSRAARYLFLALTLAALAYGWKIAGREEFIPDEGVGYWLGIAGGTTLLFQLAYPLRKRSKSMRRMGSATSWFRLHMILGIVGPILILSSLQFLAWCYQQQRRAIYIARRGCEWRHRALHLWEDSPGSLRHARRPHGSPDGCHIASHGRGERCRWSKRNHCEDVDGLWPEGARTEVWSGYKCAPCRQRGHHHAGAADPPPESHRDSGPGKRHPAGLEFRRSAAPIPVRPAFTSMSISMRSRGPPASHSMSACSRCGMCFTCLCSAC